MCTFGLTCHQIRMQLIRRLKYAALIQHGLLGLMSTMSPSNSNSEYIGGDLWGAERRYFWTHYPLSLSLTQTTKEWIICDEMVHSWLSRTAVMLWAWPVWKDSSTPRLRTSLCVHRVQIVTSWFHGYCWDFHRIRIKIWRNFWNTNSAFHKMTKVKYNERK